MTSQSLGNRVSVSLVRLCLSGGEEVYTARLFSVQCMLIICARKTANDYIQPWANTAAALCTFVCWVLGIVCVCVCVSTLYVYTLQPPSKHQNYTHLLQTHMHTYSLNLPIFLLAPGCQAATP